MDYFPRTISAVILFAFVVSGCQTTPVTATPEISQAVIQSAVAPSSSPTPLPPTVSPTNTLISETIQEVIVSSPTPFLLKTNFPKACQDQYYENSTKISPNGEWLAESCFSGEIMQVSNQDGTKMFLVESRDYFGDPNNPGLMGLVIPVHWTNDSHFIYFTVAPEQWNDGAYLTLDSFAPLLSRMNIENGETSEVLSGKFYHSFSPTDRRLIEVQEFEHPVKLVVRLKSNLT